MSRLQTIREQRIEKLKKLRQMGIDPYPPVFKRTHSIRQAQDKHGREVTIAGRVTGWREHRKMIFADLVDESGKVQLMLREDDLGQEVFSQLELYDIGDFIGVAGKVTKTKAGELTIQASKATLLSKAIRPPPSTWYGLKDVEERFRKRYLDLLMNPQVKKTLDVRFRIEREIRQFLWDDGFVEVETPVLQPLYGGTNARPFTTNMNALDSDFYLSIAPELYLKRLIVGGYEKVFEIARNFRNEGIDRTHQPEFTMIEWYEAYADYHRMMAVAESLIKHLVIQLTGTTKVKAGNKEIDISDQWSRITLLSSIKKYLKIDPEKVSDDDLQALLNKSRLKTAGVWSRGLALFTLFEHLVTDKLIEPTWVIDYPKVVSPLAKSHRDNDSLVERFEGYVGGREIADGWSEIIDPLEQRSRFENEQKDLKAGDAEAHPLDEDFLVALEYGLPPLGGIGIGIDRLVMFLTNNWSIREVVAFPTLKPKNRRYDKILL